MFVIAMLVVLAATVVLALWPAPGKYPWLVPGMLAAAGLACRLIDRFDASPFFVGPLALGVLGGLTLAHWCGIDAVKGAFLIGGSLLMLVVLFFVFVFGHRDDDDDYP